MTELGARHYDPSLGRFLQVDPILAPGNPNQNNGYTYAWNNPPANPDPDGQFPQSRMVADTTDASVPLAVGSTASRNRYHSWVMHAEIEKERTGRPYQSFDERGDWVGDPVPGSLYAELKPVMDRPTGLKGLASAIADIVGVTDAATCATQPTLGSCLATGLHLIPVIGAATHWLTTTTKAVKAAEKTGGAASVRIGQAGEAAVRGAYDIGPKATIHINGRTRILDGLNDTVVTEVKNVGYQAYTQQLKDSLAYAQQTGRQFDLFVRGGANPTTLSGPLADAISSGQINLKFIP